MQSDVGVSLSSDPRDLQTIWWRGFLARLRLSRVSTSYRDEDSVCASKSGCRVRWFHFDSKLKEVFADAEHRIVETYRLPSVPFGGQR